MLNCAVVGATGYTGIELTKILLRHPNARITALTTRQKESIPLRKFIPTLPKEVDLEIRTFSLNQIKRNADVIFLCLPHTEAMPLVKTFCDAGKIVIDLSADFRLRDAKQYESWYGLKHQAPGFLKKAVYGLTELYRDKIKNADLIANPGCYPTGVILGLAPLLKKKLIDPQSIVIDAKSGVSGAGRKPNPATQFCELDGNFYAYKVGRHQHRPEIEQALSDAAGKKIDVTFVPHLLPLERGILATIYLKMKKGIGAAEVRKAYEAHYADELFVRLKPEGSFPALKDVQHTNFCDIGFYCDSQSERLIVITAIDNLVKGAAGQAVQNMNVRAGFAEGEGLN